MFSPKMLGLAALCVFSNCADATLVALTENKLALAPMLSCTPSGTECDFYSCLESKKHYGPSGYPIAYGLKYCQKFEEDKSRFSAEGQAWIVKTRRCLQEALVPDSDSPTATCDQVQADAFGSHPRCYVESGLCTLPPRDFLALFTVIEFRDMFNAPAIRQNILIAEECAALCASTPGCVT